MIMGTKETEMDGIEEEYKKQKEELNSKCKESLGKVKALLGDASRCADNKGFKEVMDNYWAYNIANIELCSMGKYADKEQYYLQFRVLFQNNDDLFVYVDLKDTCEKKEAE